MHRFTPLAAAYVAFTGGGARSVVDKINDDPMMQEMTGNFMRGETRKAIEAPQNYGFTSVVMEATKGADGLIKESAEAFISFMGGNRSFPVATVMDDRRFRLKGLKPGDVAFYDHQQQQFHFNEKGGFLTGLKGKKLRFSLADPDEKQQQQQQASAQPSVSAHANGGSSSTGGSGGAQGGQQAGVKNGGQKARYEKESKQYSEITPDKNKSMNKKQEIWLDDDDTAIIMKEGKVYLGGDPDKGHIFSLVVTVDGPSKNVYARLP